VKKRIALAASAVLFYVLYFAPHAAEAGKAWCRDC
jgi:hypothetical protein